MKQYEYSGVYYKDVRALIASMNGNGVAYGKHGWRIFSVKQDKDGYVTAILERETETENA